MHLSVSLTSIVIGLCLTGAQADLPYGNPVFEREDSNALKDRQNVGEHHRRPFPTSPGGIIIPTGTPPRDLHARKNPPSPGAQHPPTDKFGALAFAADVREGHETVPGFRGPTGTGFTTVTRTDTGIVEPTWHFPTITPPEN